jgi:hypothetical protein
LPNRDCQPYQAAAVLIALWGVTNAVPTFMANGLEVAGFTTVEIMIRHNANHPNYRANKNNSRPHRRPIVTLASEILNPTYRQCDKYPCDYLVGGIKQESDHDIYLKFAWFIIFAILIFLLGISRSFLVGMLIFLRHRRV